MKKLKLIISSVVVFALGLISLLSPAKVYAEEVYANEYEQAFFESYETIWAYNELGGITSTNVEDYYLVAGTGVAAGEEAELITEGFLLSHRNEREVLTVAYKNATKFKIDNSFTLDEIAPTENGTMLIATKLNEAKQAINVAATKSEIDAAYNAFLSFLESGEIVYNSQVLQSAIDAEMKGSATATSKIFSPDDVLKITTFTDSVITRNTGLAIKDNALLPVENGGIAKYFSIRWVRNGVVMDDAGQAVSISINLESLGVTAEDGESVCLARYLGNGNVDFLEATISGGNLVFNLSSFGGDIETDYDLDFAIVLAGYPATRVGFMFEYWQIVLIAIGVIALIYIIIKIIQVSARSKERKAFKKFKREQKKQRAAGNAEGNAAGNEQQAQPQKPKKKKPIGGTNVVKPRKGRK